MSALQKQTPGWSPANADTNAESFLIVGGERVDRKVVATYAAKFARAGHQMHVVHKAGGSSYFAVSRWNQSRHCSTLHELDAFLVQVTGGAQ
ncbi:MAG: hypothetical protein EOO27_19515 [Comamonadaceae bacterium]|nr:MAG: hypothetical protein EOO27_19515 [Comamonadaceae bacterium]